VGGRKIEFERVKADGTYSYPYTVNASEAIVAYFKVPP
jgi:hypothetical protein